MKTLITIFSLTFLAIIFLPSIDYVNHNPIEIDPIVQELETPKLNSDKSIEIDLTNEIISLWQGGNIITTLPIAYQAREGNWFQSPTGYFRVGEMEKNKKSSLTGVNMPYSIQIYEDFFIHEIPFFDDGIRLTSAYSGGCLRLETEHAKTLFEFAEKRMSVVVFKTIDGYKLKPQYHEPVDLKTSWIRQSFNNPIRETYKYGGNLDKIGLDYVQHTGVDFSGEGNVYSIADGIVAGIWENGDAHGLGNTLIIDYGEFYALYGHLEKPLEWTGKLKVGDRVSKGSIIGQISNTGYGCNYWRIGEDGCNSKNPPDNHLHFEIKSKPVLENPTGEEIFYGYTLNNPESYGYQNPMKVLFD